MTEAPEKIWVHYERETDDAVWLEYSYNDGVENFTHYGEYTRSDIADTLRAEVARLKAALRTMVYEATHLPQEEDDVSHWCKFTFDALQAARAALAHGETDQ
tara:strand:- start:1264 stop:1569 length:306 start_codon:yes stop_codon:yes gene_type:complete